MIFYVLQVHTFYEALGCMIAAQTETQQQERLIENYMSLPNQVWDGIILHATQVRLLTLELWKVTCDVSTVTH